MVSECRQALKLLVIADKYHAGFRVRMVSECRQALKLL